MKHLLKLKLFEKSSLTYLGVPNDVMVDIQKQFALPDDVQWQELTYKKDLRTELRKGDNLFVTISENNINVIFLVKNELYIDVYNFYQEDDMGDEYWDKDDRIQSTITDINKMIPRNAKIYKLLSNNWSYEGRAKRRLKTSSIEFDDFTVKFKKEFADNFTRIIKKLYSKHSEVIQKLIIRTLITQSKDISHEEAKEILSLNIDKAKQSDFYRKQSQDKDPFKLQLNYIRDNSLTIFNEFLIIFEDKMTEKYGEYLNIPELCKKYGRDKIMTAFAYYLYSGKIMEL